MKINKSREQRMYAYAAEAQPASPTHGGTAYIQPLVPIIKRTHPTIYQKKEATADTATSRFAPKAPVAPKWPGKTIRVGIILKTA